MNASKISGGDPGAHGIACLLLDGALLPEGETERTRLVDAVVLARLRGLAARGKSLPSPKRAEPARLLLCSSVKYV